MDDVIIKFLMVEYLIYRNDVSYQMLSKFHENDIRPEFLSQPISCKKDQKWIKTLINSISVERIYKDAQSSLWHKVFVL